MIGVAALGTGTLLRRRSFRLGAVLGAVVPIAVLLTLSLLPRGGPSTTESISPEIAAQQRAFTAFQGALEPVVAEGGAVVVYGMRPGINDIYDRRFDDETLVAMAQGWVEGIGAARDDFAAIDVPGFLTEVAQLYRQAFDEYLATAEALVDAATETGDTRGEHISRAAEHGVRADQLYDTAKAELDGHRQRLGLEAAG